MCFTHNSNFSIPFGINVYLKRHILVMKMANEKPIINALCMYSSHLFHVPVQTLQSIRPTIHVHCTILFCDYRSFELFVLRALMEVRFVSKGQFGETSSRGEHFQKMFSDFEHKTESRETPQVWSKFVAYLY